MGKFNALHMFVKLGLTMTELLIVCVFRYMPLNSKSSYAFDQSSLLGAVGSKMGKQF